MDQEEKEPLNQKEDQDNDENLGELALEKHRHLITADQRSDSEANSYEIMEDGMPDLSKQKSKSNYGLAMFNYVSAAVGLGDLALPRAISKAGYGLGLVGLVLSAWFNNYVMILLLKTADRKQVSQRITYEALAEEHYGKWGSRSVKISLLVMQLGSSISSILFMNQFLTYTFCGRQPEHACSSLPENILITSLIIFPLILIDNYHYFAFAGIIETIFMGVGIVAQAVYNFNILQSGEGLWYAMKHNISEFKFEGFPLFFGVAITSYGTIGSLFSIRRSMKMPRKMQHLATTSSIILWFLYTVYSAVIYLAHQERTPDIALLTLPQENKFYLFAQFIYMISIGLGYPLQFIVGIHILENTSYLKPKLFDEHGRTKNGWIRYGMRYLIQIVVLAVGFALQSLSLFLNLIGCFLTAYLLFFLPIMIYHKDRKGEYPMWKKIVHGCLMVFGIIVGVSGMILSIKEMIDFGDSPMDQSTVKL